MASISDKRTTFFGSGTRTLVAPVGFGVFGVGSVVRLEMLLLLKLTCEFSAGEGLVGEDVKGTEVKRLVRHSMHLSRRFAHGEQMYVCPQGRTTGI
jgi:hypothetical protein